MEIFKVENEEEDEGIYSQVQATALALVALLNDYCKSIYI